MRRLLLALLLAGTVAHAQVRELSSVVRPLDGSTVGDVTGVAITATSPITGTATCTGGACAFTLGLTVPGAGSELVYRASGTTLGAALGSAITAGTGAITLTSQGAAVTPLTIVPHAGQTAPLILFSTDTGLARASAGVVKVTDGGAGAGSILVADGTAAAPSVARSAGNTGVYFSAAPTIRFSIAGNNYFAMTGGAFNLMGDALTLTLGASNDVILTRGGNPATLQLGAANAASPVAQKLQAQGSRGGTDTDVAGATLTIRPGAGTGAATGSTLIFQTPTPTTSGSTAQTQTTRLTLSSAGVNIPNLATYADNAAALAGGLVAGDLYRTSAGVLMVTY